MGIGRKFPRVKEGKLHPSYVLIEIRLKLRILHVKWYLKIIGGSWPEQRFSLSSPARVRPDLKFDE